MVDVYPPRALPPSDATDDTPLRGVLAPRVNLLADAVAGIVRVLGGAPQGTDATTVTAAQASTLTRLGRLGEQIEEVYSVLSQAASGSNGDLLNRINGVRTDLAAAVARIVTLEDGQAAIRNALGDLTALRASYGNLVARLAAPNPAAAVFSDFAGVGTLWSPAEVRLVALSIPSPGYAYRLQVSGQLRVGPEVQGSSIDLHLRAVGGGQEEYAIGVAAAPNLDAGTNFLRFDFPVQDRVHEGSCIVNVYAVRSVGTARGQHDTRNRQLRVARWRA